MAEVHRAGVARAPTPRRALPLLTEASPSAMGAPAPRTSGMQNRAALLARKPSTSVTPPRSVRISVIDRCDFACTYCRPSRSEGYTDGRLLADEWSAMFEGLRKAGVRRVRLTGGEPLLHPNIVGIVERLAALGFEDLAVTTNASQLDRLAGPLKRAGLHRINISIDTLDEQRFSRLTRGGRLAPVLRGIDAALDAGLTPIKLNTVVLRGENDDEIERLTRWAWERRMVPRFLEIMPIAEGAKLVGQHLVTVAEMRRSIAHLVQAEEATLEPGRGPAKYLHALGDPTLRVGFISGTSDTYCDGCDRLRVTSTGALRPCLATEDGVEAGAEARAGDADAVAEKISEAWANKPDGSTWKGCTEETAAHVSMRAIGG